MKWETIRTEVDVTHVHPLGDLIDHDTDDQGDCVCGPGVELHTGTLVGDFTLYIHHALRKPGVDLDTGS